MNPESLTGRLLTAEELTNVYLNEMRRDFPAGELKPLSMILNSEAAGTSHTWGVYEDDALVAYLLMVRPVGCEVSQLDYFAVLPQYRAGGIGAALLAALPDHEKGAQAILIEAECPEKAEDEAMAVRRLGFYARCGAKDTGWTEHLFDAWFVRAGAGENWHDFVSWTLERGWPGLENLALIPGTVGAAPVQNIGAYGLEMAERFHTLEAVDLETGETVVLDRAACQFGYRDSVFKREAAGRSLITAVTFQLPKHWRPITGYADVARELEAPGIIQPTAREVADAVIALRLRKLPDPAHIGNAGSFFKNPRIDAQAFQNLVARYPDLPHYPQPDGTVKLAAGWLIERCGWKGKTLGPVGVYERQALVLVNRGGARGEDVLRLARAIQASMRATFGVDLELEPVMLGA